MTSDEYWNGDCDLVKYFRQANKLKIEKKNQDLWLQGCYIYEAITSGVATVFRKENTQPIPYIAEPFPNSKEESEQRKEKKQKENYELHKAKRIAEMNEINRKFKEVN